MPSTPPLSAWQSSSRGRSSLLVQIASLVSTVFLFLALLWYHVKLQCALWYHAALHHSPPGDEMDEAYFTHTVRKRVDAARAAGTSAPWRVPNHLAVIVNSVKDRSILDLVCTGIRARLSSQPHAVAQQEHSRRMAQYRSLLHSVRSLVRSASQAGVGIVSVYDMNGMLCTLFSRVQQMAQVHLDHHEDQDILPQSIFTIALEVLNSNETTNFRKERRKSPLCAFCTWRPNLWGPSSSIWRLACMLVAHALPFARTFLSFFSALPLGRSALVWACAIREELEKSSNGPLRGSMSNSSANETKRNYRSKEKHGLPPVKVQLSLAVDPFPSNLVRPPTCTEGNFVILHIIGPWDGHQSLARVAEGLSAQIVQLSEEYADDAMFAQEQAREVLATSLSAVSEETSTMEPPLGNVLTHDYARRFRRRQACRYSQRRLSASISPKTISNRLSGRSQFSLTRPHFHSEFTDNFM